MLIIFILIGIIGKDTFNVFALITNLNIISISFSRQSAAHYPS